MSAKDDPNHKNFYLHYSDDYLALAEFRRMIMNYARYQMNPRTLDGRPRFTLCEFVGLSEEEFEMWARTGKISTRWIRVLRRPIDVPAVPERLGEVPGDAVPDRLPRRGPHHPVLPRG